MKNFRKKVIFVCLLFMCTSAMSANQGFAPVILKETTSVRCQLDGIAVFQASVAGAPKPVLEIHYDNGHFIDMNIVVSDFYGRPRMKYTSEYYNGSCSFEIHDVDARDFREYYFLFYNVHGQRVSRFALKML